MERFGLGEHRPGAGRNELAGLGRQDRTGRAAQQLDPQLPLEPLDLVRERRLCDVELVRGVGEVAVADDRLEVAELPDVHADTSYFTINVFAYVSCIDQSGEPHLSG